MSELCYESVCNLRQLHTLVTRIQSQLHTSKIILLRGNLASGKTTFVKAFADALGIKEMISSPTFSILHEYNGILFHYDIYQCGIDGFLQSGLMEKFDIEGYHLIEWGDKEFEKLLQHFGISYSTIEIETIHSQRNYKVHINAYS